MPVTERQLLGIERKYKLNDELYIFLLEMRDGAQLQKASNTSDNKMIKPAKPDSKPVSPKTTLSYIIALLARLGFPFLWIILADTFNYRVRNEEDILRIPEMPLAGNMPNSRFKTPVMVFEEPHSHMARLFALSDRGCRSSQKIKIHRSY